MLTLLSFNFIDTYTVFDEVVDLIHGILHFSAVV